MAVPDACTRPSACVADIIHDRRGAANAPGIVSNIVSVGIRLNRDLPCSAVDSRVWISG